MPAHGQFDRIGDDVAAYERRFHAGVAHGDAVGDGDGGELPGRAAGGLNSGLRRLGLAAKRDVTRRRLVPRSHHPDERLGDVFLAQPHGVVVRPVRRPLRPHRHMA